MSEPFCAMSFDHEPGETCAHCNLTVDMHGNTEADFRNCCFPDCGCDGARLCMAPNGASYGSLSLNIEKGTLRHQERKPIPVEPPPIKKPKRPLLRLILGGKK